MKAQNSGPLRLALLGNAIFSAVSAVLLIAFSGKVGSIIGVSNHLLLAGIGIGLGIFSADLFHQASRRRMQTWRALYASLGDAMWVAGTVILLIWFPHVVSDQGRLLLIAVALIVALFGCLQFSPLITPLLGLKADIDFPPIVFRMAGIEDGHASSKSVIGRILLPSPSC